MNVKTVLDRIQSIISSFKNAHLKISNLKENNLVPSYTSISEDTDFNAIKEIQLAKLASVLSVTPQYMTPESTSRSVDSISFSTSFCIYPNVRIENIVFNQNVASYEIPIALVDNNSIIFDARLRGGGLKDSYVNDVASSNIFIPSFSDIGNIDGKPLSASASIIIKLPEDIKTKYTEKTIKSIINKYTTTGIYPIIMYYSTASVESFGWNLEGSEDK